MTAPTHIACRRPIDEFAPDGCTQPLEHAPDNAEHGDWLATLLDDVEAEQDERTRERRDAMYWHFLGLEVKS